MARRITVAELERIEGRGIVDILEEAVYDTGFCPAMCSEGCEVEMDGHCCHGFPSLAMHVGMV